MCIWCEYIILFKLENEKENQAGEEIILVDFMEIFSLIVQNAVNSQCTIHCETSKQKSFNIFLTTSPYLDGYLTRSLFASQQKNGEEHPYGWIYG